MLNCFLAWTQRENVADKTKLNFRRKGIISFSALRSKMENWHWASEKWPTARYAFREMFWKLSLIVCSHMRWHFKKFAPKKFSLQFSLCLIFDQHELWSPISVFKFLFSFVAPCEYIQVQIVRLFFFKNV